MRALRVAALLATSACAATDVPPVETSYFLDQLARARTAPAARQPAEEAAVLREAAASLDVRAVAETARVRRGDETEGLLDVESPGAREFLARLADPAKAEDVLATTPLDLDHVLLAVHARNPDVAAARGNWAATVRMYEQATYLEDLLLRYSAFTRLATPRIGAAPMREAAFPYPGLVALKGEMIDREVAMAREMSRMRLRDAMVAAAKASHEVAHHAEELAIREEQVAVAKRVVAVTRSRVESGRGPQAELLEMEADLAMAENDRAHAIVAGARARGELNTLLARAPDAPLAVAPHGDPPAETPPRAPWFALAARFSPEVRIARAEASRTGAAIRMAEAMLFAPPSPGAVARGAPMGGTTPMSADALPPRDEPPVAAPGAFGPDVAWVAELKERHTALGRAAEEAGLAAERRVVDAWYELDSARRMFELAAKATEPLAAQAVEERIRLYESGRGEFAELTAALQRRLVAAHDAAAARSGYGTAEAMLWMAAGARPEAVRTEAGEEETK
jgi:outer membrane protein, heavy metal efflux system